MGGWWWLRANLVIAFGLALAFSSPSRTIASSLHLTAISYRSNLDESVKRNLDISSSARGFSMKEASMHLSTAW